MLSWLPSYLKMARGFTWVEMGSLSALPYLVGAVSMILSGYLMFRVKRNTLFMWTGGLVIAIGMTLAVISKNNLASALWLVVAMGGICWGFGASFAVLQKIVSAPIIARATGLYQGIASISSGFVPYIIGALITINNGSFTVGFFFLVIVALIEFCIAMILFTREGRTFGKLNVQPATDGLAVNK